MVIIKKIFYFIYYITHYLIIQKINILLIIHGIYYLFIKKNF
jgi:hypothetical protein